LSRPRSGAPRFSASRATSSRSHIATCSAIVQRNVAGGETVTFAWSARITESSSTASTAPHSPAPTRTGNGLNVASFASRSWQADGFAGPDAAPAGSGNDAYPSCGGQNCSGMPAGSTARGPGGSGDGTGRAAAAGAGLPRLADVLAASCAAANWVVPISKTMRTRAFTQRIPDRTAVPDRQTPGTKINV
jgi:hypothetical protein